MGNNQKGPGCRQAGFAPVLVLGVVVVAIVTVFLVSKNFGVSNLNLGIPSPGPSSCLDYNEFSKFVFSNVINPDQGDPEVIRDFNWKRKTNEPYVVYPAVFKTSLYHALNKDEEVNAEMQYAYEHISAGIENKAKMLGFEKDQLNSRSIRNYYINQIAMFGFRKGKDLYSLVLKSSKNFQSIGEMQVVVACGIPNSELDKVYDLLNVRAGKYDPNYHDEYESDVVTAYIPKGQNYFTVSGGANHSSIDGDYVLERQSLKRVSK